tara:strand:+ start:5965 stop:7893 length:1929 start_codon:yes stop_codon:yes gene_type:complete
MAPPTKKKARLSEKALEEMKAYEDRKAKITSQNIRESIYGWTRGLAGAPYTKGELFGGMTEGDVALRRVQAIEALERLARVEQLYEQEGLKFHRGMVRAKSQSSRDWVLLMNGKMSAWASVESSVTSAQIRAAQASEAKAWDEQVASGWSNNKKRDVLPTSIANKLAKYPVNSIRVLGPNGFEITRDPAIQSQLIRNLAVDLNDIHDPSDRAFFLQALGEKSSIDFWSLLTVPKDQRGGRTYADAPELPILAGEALRARTNMESVDRQAISRRKHWNDLARQSAAHAKEDPKMLDHMIKIKEDTFNPSSQITGWGTHQRPPADDAPIAERKAYIHALTDGWMTVNESGNVAYTDLGAKHDPKGATTIWEWGDFTRRLPKKQPTALEKATDHIEDFLQDLVHGQTKTHEQNRQNFYESDVFLRYKDTRFKGMAVDNEFVLESFASEASAQRGMDREAAEKAKRDDIIEGNVAATPHQVRMAKLSRFISGDKKEETREASDSALLTKGASSTTKMAKRRTEAEPEKDGPWAVGTTFQKDKPKGKWDELQEKKAQVAKMAESSDWKDPQKMAREPGLPWKAEDSPPMPPMPTKKEMRRTQRSRKRDKKPTLASMETKATEAIAEQIRQANEEARKNKLRATSEQE